MESKVASNPSLLEIEIITTPPLGVDQDVAVIAGTDPKLLSSVLEVTRDERFRLWLEERKVADTPMAGLMDVFAEITPQIEADRELGLMRMSSDWEEYYESQVKALARYIADTSVPFWSEDAPFEDAELDFQEELADRANSIAKTRSKLTRKSFVGFVGSSATSAFVGFNSLVHSNEDGAGVFAVDFKTFISALVGATAANYSVEVHNKLKPSLARRVARKRIAKADRKQKRRATKNIR